MLHWNRAACSALQCGGDAAAFSTAAPLLRLLGKRAVHCGGAGSRQAAKLCNNLVLAGEGALD